MILSWSSGEAARYIETLKALENKSPTSIQEKVENDFVPKLSSVLTSISSINRTDVVTLLEAFGNFKNVCCADDQQLILCPGLGEKKVTRLFSALNAPFVRNKTSCAVVLPVESSNSLS